MPDFLFLFSPSELMQTEMHHIRTLRIMSEVYSKGLQKELQLELQTVEKLFPVLDDLLELHTQHLLRLLERKRESQLEGGYLDGGFVINRIGDILVNQVRGERVWYHFCVPILPELVVKEAGRLRKYMKRENQNY